MKTKKEEYARLGITIPTQLLDELDKYCSSILTGNPKIRSAVLRQAIEEFLK